MPGAMMLRARQKPQNRYHTKPGTIFTEAAFKANNRANTAHMDANRERKEPPDLPCSPASRHREGSMPIIRPIKRQMEKPGYLVRK